MCGNGLSVGFRNTHYELKATKTGGYGVRDRTRNIGTLIKLPI